MKREAKFVRTNLRRASRRKRSRSGRRQQRRQQLRNRSKNERQKGRKMSNVNNKRRSKKGQICAILLKIVLAGCWLLAAGTNTKISSSCALAVPSSLFIQFNFFYFIYSSHFIIIIMCFPSRCFSSISCEWVRVCRQFGIFFIFLLTSTLDC